MFSSLNQASVVISHTLYMSLLRGNHFCKFASAAYGISGNISRRTDVVVKERSLPVRDLQEDRCGMRKEGIYSHRPRPRSAIGCSFQKIAVPVLETVTTWVFRLSTVVRIVTKWIFKHCTFNIVLIQSRGLFCSDWDYCTLGLHVSYSAIGHGSLMDI